MSKLLGTDHSLYLTTGVTMGQVKEVNLKTEAMEDPEKLKGEGNDAFKARNYEEALAKYTKAINLTDKDTDKSTYLKNRAAVHLKNEDYDKAVDDCTAALEISQKLFTGDAKLMRLWTRLSRFILMLKLFIIVKQS